MGKLFLAVIVIVSATALILAPAAHADRAMTLIIWTS